MDRPPHFSKLAMMDAAIKAYKNTPAFIFPDIWQRFHSTRPTLTGEVVNRDYGRFLDYYVQEIVYGGGMIVYEFSGRALYMRCRNEEGGEYYMTTMTYGRLR